MKHCIEDWYAVYTLPKFEKKIFGELNKRNVESYLPLQTVRRKWSDRVKKIDVPLFPNYVFIRSTEFRLASICVSKGIVRLVSFAGEPARIPESDINKIKRLEANDVEVEPSLVEGSPVRIIRGPLAGFEGTLFSKKGKCRFGVHIESLRQSISVEVPAIFLEEL